MLSDNDPDVDVDALMSRVHNEVLRRQVGDPVAPSGHLETFTTAAIEEQIAVAAQRAGARTRWPARIAFFPFGSARVQRAFLRAGSWLLRDQHVYNAAVLKALRESVALNRRMYAMIIELETRIRRLEERD